MRPAGSVGEVRQALLQAAHDLAGPNKCGILLELAAHSQVGFAAANNTLKNMVRDGDLVIVRKRPVLHCTKPVAEYAPADAADDVRRGAGWVDLARCVGGWAR